ncbi:glycosyltransferase family 2 protein [Elioraea rosea]|uniref:glycosyltransferase family 2 protein n=1 Tax=Elioraea rosea TaxID=2492390 RepID=UPI001185EF64|nr:glycosyltransferase family A protein [Elioraea rosea]
MRFSLVVATKGRSDEIGALLGSILAQAVPAEVIVVDQNEDERVAPVLAPYAGRLPLTHLRSRIANANNSRNLGLRHARGEIVAFPDDDCVMPDGVLARVDRAFADDPALAILTGPAASPEGGLGSGRWRGESGAITLANVWTSVIEFNLFLRREVALALGGFDERLGPGTEFGSAEGNDLVARAIRAGHVVRYDAGLRIVHPDKRLTPIAASRAGLYGAGLGVVLRRHAPGPGTWFPFLVRPLGGVAVSLLRGRGLAARYYYETFRGRLRGLLAAEEARRPAPPPQEPLR